MNILELRDAENHMIRPIYGNEFKNLIVYQDPGTLVLHAPDGLTDTLIPVDIDHQHQLQPGDLVQVAYRGGDRRDKVEILDAVIEKVTVSRETPVYQLRSLSGQLLSPGDSGGGVWHGDDFVGNNWFILLTYTLKETSSATDLNNITQTDLSEAAILPGIFQ
jgi:hypothetical protein